VQVFLVLVYKNTDTKLLQLAVSVEKAVLCVRTGTACVHSTLLARVSHPLSLALPPPLSR
jgi:hypothetical protein